jgi:uncharacterized repeat protein (TIGR03833 family)
MKNTIRSNLKPGLAVDVVLKKDQPTGNLTRGIIKKILSPGIEHPRGIKVMLDDGQVGRVQKILSLIYYYSDQKYQKIMTPNELKKFGKVEDIGLFPDWIICRTSKQSNSSYIFEHWIVVDDLDIHKWVIVSDLHTKPGLLTSKTNYNNIIIKNSGDSVDDLIKNLPTNSNKDLLLHVSVDIHPIKILRM